MIHPIQTPVSSADTTDGTPLAATWTDSLASSTNVLSKVFNWSSTSLVGAPGIELALTLAGPILTSILGDEGPDLQDVLDELDDLQDDLQQMQQELSTISTQILQDGVDTEVGDCDLQISELESYRSTIDEANEDYLAWITALQDVRTSGTADAKNARDQFINSVIGTDLLVFDTELANAIDTIHTSLTSQAGIIQTCGQASMTTWKADNLPPATVGADSSGAWVDDREYYDGVTQVVQFWQIAESHALFLLQQAVLMKLGSEWPRHTDELTREDSQQICSLAVTAVPHLHSLCTSMQSYGSTTAYGYLTAEWAAAGVPYTDDDVILSIGSSTTSGVPGSVPFTAWVRDPGSSGIPWATTPQSWATTQTAATFDGIDNWLPAGSVQWEGLNSGYLATHTSVAPAEYPARGAWYTGSGGSSDIYAGSNLPEYRQFDLLTTMQSVTTTDGAAFTTAGVDQVWMPNETASQPLNSWDIAAGTCCDNTNPGYGFPPTWVTEGTALDASTHDANPFYGDTGLTVKCMVLTPDGVLCGDATVASWWVGQLQSSFSVVSSNFFTGNWTASGSFSVTPSSSTAGAFVASGLNAGCSPGPCGVGLNTMTSLPGWIVDFTSVDQVAFDAPDSPAAVWPASSVPTDPSCLSNWGMPTRCGPAMQAWLAANVPNPNVTGPVASTGPTITDSPAGLVCGAPTWAAPTDAGGAALVTGPTVTWTATGPDGTTSSATSTGTTPLPVSQLVTAAMDAPSALKVACSWTAWFADAAANVTHTTSESTPVALVSGAWVVEHAAVDVTLDAAHLEDGRRATAKLTVTNTGNVPLHDVQVSHQPGTVGSPAMSWPGRTGALQPGETATGTAIVDRSATADPGAAVPVGSRAGRSGGLLMTAAGITVTSTVQGTAPSGTVVTDTDRRDLLFADPTADPTSPTDAAPTVTVTVTPTTPEQQEAGSGDGFPWNSDRKAGPGGYPGDGPGNAAAQSPSGAPLASTGAAITPVLWVGGVLLLAGVTVLVLSRNRLLRHRSQH
ncbi:DUF7507 domain-containing protein [Nakamurella leprariae]|uniref:DUF7507 domain-containing protein n=1 Tax=Nakamurella leprariae TaxID=2803911 RepID=A0A938YBB8_9ACTN|nr:hypothetical protein [Nakamurella leprariae]MBM9469350.1 hypothetical protein [Nakamurella leprariae]